MAHSFNLTSLPSLRKIVAATGLSLGLVLAGCTPAETDASADPRPSVIASNTIIADLTEDIGGDRINLTGMLRPGDDPHIYEPVPADIKALEQADLVLYNGLNLEPALIRLLEAGSKDATHIAVGEVADLDVLDMDEEGQTQPDPHVWGDVTNAIAMVNAIRDSLIDLSPEDQAIFIANAQTLNSQLADLDTWISRQIETIPEEQRLLVTTHDAFQYYTTAYELEMLGTLIGISTEEQPSAQTVQSLVNEIKTRGVPAIFAETTINPQLIKTVAEEAGVKLAEQELYSDSIGATGSSGDSYLNMMESNTKTIVEALGGSHTPFIKEAPAAANSESASPEAAPASATP